MLKLLFVIGTRPEAIKMAPVIRYARKLPESLECVVCSTGQHRDLLDQAFFIFDFCADECLDLMDYDQSLPGLTARMMESLSGTISRIRPDWVVIQGDTTTAFVSALSTYYHHIPIAHVEAGMRTGNLMSPFPEEGNRQMIARLATIHFAATKRSAGHLLQENISPSSIFVTGNTVVDSVALIREKPLNEKFLVSLIHGNKIPLSSFLDKKKIALVTCHRRESFGKPLEGILKSLYELAKIYPHIDWIFPVHPNPNVRKPVLGRLGSIPNVYLVEPVNYSMALKLMEESTIIVSDSGGIQEEAPCFGTPVVVMRHQTEREEGVVSGFATLAGTDPNCIIKAAREWLDHPEVIKDLANKPNPYGDGHASERIVRYLLGRSVDEFDG